MFKYNRLGLFINLICMHGIALAMYITMLVSKFFPLIVIFSLPLSFYFCYFAVQAIISCPTMKFFREKNVEKVDLRDSYIRSRKDVTDSL